MKTVVIFVLIFLILNTGNLTAAGDVGAISGKILLDRDPPPLPQIIVDKNVEFCGETLIDSVLIVQNRGIQGAIVSLNWENEVTTTDDTPPSPIHLQSRGCRFHPRIQATQLGNYLILNSGDEVTHNPHGWWNNTKTLFNITLLNQNQKFKRKLRWEGTYRVECDTHTWMKSYILVFKHPFHAVTGEDGTFHLQNVPSGNHTLRVWHEVLGEQTAKIIVVPQKRTEKDFVMPLIDKRPKQHIPKTVDSWPPE